MVNCHISVAKNINQISLLFVESIAREPEVLKYFYIRSEEHHFLYEYQTKVSVGTEPMSCRWPSYYSLFHWTGQYLLNARGAFLGVEHHNLCGPGFEYQKDRKPKTAT